MIVPPTPGQSRLGSSSPDQPNRVQPGRRLRSYGVLVALCLIATACTGGDAEGREPAEALAAAGDRLAAAETVHVVIGADNLPDGGAALIAAEGDAVRPDGFAGSLAVRATGVTLDVEVLSRNGEVYAQLPFTDSLTQVDPADLGFSDPGTLIAIDGGIGQALQSITDLQSQPAERIDGENLDVITGTLPGQLVADLLTSVDPSQPVPTTVWINAESDELRMVSLTGPFYDPEQPTTYTVTLTDYDQPVTLPTPPAGQ